MDETRATRLGPTRAEVLHHLRTLGGPTPVTDVAEAMGLHPNTTRFHLDALTGSGLVVREAEQRGVPGRPKMLYRATHGHQTDPYESLAAAMVTHFAGSEPDRDQKALSAGEAWGEELRTTQGSSDADDAPLDRLLDTMQGLGYQPRLVVEPEPVIELTPCPYIAIASQDPTVVCQVHLGLVRGVLGPDQPWRVTTIEPWVTPTLCVLRLSHDEEHTSIDA